MNCEAAKVLIAQMGRNAPMDARLRTLALEHSRNCQRCGQSLMNERMLSAGLGLLADSHLAVEAPLRLEAAVMNAFRTERREIRRRKSKVRWSAAGAIAACLAIGTVMVVEHATRSNPGAVPIAQDLGGAAELSVSDQESFVSLPFSEPLQPFERTELQSVTLTRATLIAMGVGPGLGNLNSDPDEAVKAEIIVGENDVPRAVRLLD